jgi:hypothetical protein
MEYIVAAGASTLAVSYGAYIAFSVEKGKPWALGVARAIAMLDPQSVDPYLRDGLALPPAEAQPEPEIAAEPDRLAA